MPYYLYIFKFYHLIFAKYQIFALNYSKNDRLVYPTAPQLNHPKIANAISKMDRAAKHRRVARLHFIILTSTSLLKDPRAPSAPPIRAIDRGVNHELPASSACLPRDPVSVRRSSPGPSIGKAARAWEARTQPLRLPSWAAAR